jgi:tetratricopeptide (TPR) repeat protein
MRKRPRATMADLELILANQRALGKRFIWLLLLPVVLSTALLVMLYITTTRLTGVEVVAKQLTIEQLFNDDGNYEEAVDQYKQLSEIRPSSAILARLGLLYFQLDPKRNQRIAIETLEKAKSLDPNYWVTYRYLNYIYTEQGNAEDAIASGEEGLKHNQFDAKLYNNLAWIYATTDKPFANLERAQQYAERARELTNSKYSDVLDTLAEVYYRKGGQENRRQALDLLRKADAMCPKGDTRYKMRIAKLFPTERAVTERENGL